MNLGHPVLPKGSGQHSEAACGKPSGDRWGSQSSARTGKAEDLTHRAGHFCGSSDVSKPEEEAALPPYRIPGNSNSHIYKINEGKEVTIRKILQ